MGKPDPAGARSDVWFETHDGVRASISSTEASEIQAAAEDCDGYDEPVTLAYGFGGPGRGGRASVPITVPQALTGDTAAASHVDLRPPLRPSSGSPSSRCSLDSAWTKSLVPLKASELSSALRPLAEGSAPLEDDGSYLSLLPAVPDMRLSDVDAAAAGASNPSPEGGSSTGAQPLRRCLTPPGSGRTSLDEPGRSLPVNGSGRFRLNRTRSSLVRAQGAVTRDAEHPRVGGPTAGRPTGPLKSPSFSVDLGSPLRGVCFCVCARGLPVLEA